MYYAKCNVGYVVKIEVGEEIQDALRQFAEATSLKGASYQGIGVLNRVELAFFCTDLKLYDRKFFDDEYEISLLGNLSKTDGAYAPHTHITLSDRNFQTYSGHLVRGIVSVTVEIVVTQLDLALTREDDPILQYKSLVIPRPSQLKVHG